MIILRNVMIVSLSAILMAMLSFGFAQAGPGHSGPHGESGHQSLEQLRKEHQDHQHEHDFKAMDEMTPKQTERLIKLMREVGLALPPMDSHRGHLIFMNKGCVVCHKVNGVGREVGPDLDAAKMPSPMNAFEFAARMWKGAPAMVEMQKEELGDVIQLSGQELADLIAFVHDGEMQKTVTKEQIPKRWKKKINH
jgi:cytochrome c